MFKKLKNVTSKLDEGMKFFIIIMFVISVFYLIFSAIFSNNKVTSVTYNDAKKFVNIYLDTDSENEDIQYLVKEYNEYYTVASAVDNFLNGIVNDKVMDLYNILDKTLKKEYSLKKFGSEIEKIDEELLDNYEDANYIKNIYLVSDHHYICNLEYNDFRAIIGIKLDNNKYNTYKIFYLKIGD